MVCLPGPGQPLSSSPASSPSLPLPQTCSMGTCPTRLFFCTRPWLKPKLDRPHFLALPPPRPGASSRAPSPPPARSHTQNPRNASPFCLMRRQLHPSEHRSHPQLSPLTEAPRIPPTSTSPCPAPPPTASHVPSLLGQGALVLSSGHVACVSDPPRGLCTHVSSAWEALPPDVHVHFTRPGFPGHSSRNPSFQIKTPMEGLPWVQGLRLGAPRVQEAGAQSLVRELDPTCQQ